MKTRPRAKKVLLSLGVSLLTASAVQVHAQDLEQASKGRELYEKHCSACHGEAAAGQNRDHPAGGWDQNNNRLAPALNGTGHAWHHSPSMMYQYIQEGSMDETSPMPSFGGRLNDKDIRSIISYIHSLWPNEIMKNFKERFKNEIQ